MVVTEENNVNLDGCIEKCGMDVLSRVTVWREGNMNNKCG